MRVGQRRLCTSGIEMIQRVSKRECSMVEGHIQNAPLQGKKEDCGRQSGNRR